MNHPTYRSLDAPVKAFGFSLRQWAWIVLGGGAIIGLVYASGMPFKPALTLCTLTIGVPVCFAYLSDGDGFSVGQLLVDLVRWRLAPRSYAIGASGAERAVVIERRAVDHAPAVEGPTLAERLDELWEL